MKKTLAMALSIVLVFASLSCIAQAEEGPKFVTIQEWLDAKGECGDCMLVLKVVQELNPTVALVADETGTANLFSGYDKEHARPWTVEFAETGFFYDPREDLIRLDTDLATLWCDTIYRTEPSDGGVTEIVYSLWDHVGNLSPQQRRDLDEILARKIRSLSSCRAMMHLDDDLGAPLRNPYDGKPDPILDVSPDLRPAITKLSPEKPHAESAEPEPHAESAEGAESEPHAESAESAESEPHAESAESAKSEPHAESAEGAE